MGDETDAFAALERACLVRGAIITRPGDIVHIIHFSRLLLLGSAVCRSRGPYTAHFICIYIPKKAVAVSLSRTQICVWDSRVSVKTQALAKNSLATNRVKTWVKPKGRIAAGCF